MQKDLKIVKKANPKIEEKVEEKPKTKAVITILGLISSTKKNLEDNSVIKKTEEDKALYLVEDGLKKFLIPPKKQYTNMFPLLVDTFSTYKIIGIATKSSEEIQKKVIEFEGLKEENIEYRQIDEKEDYHTTFATINQILNDYDEVIVDLSHGFRHLPLLTIISLIIQNIKNTQKIKAILFAQEIEKDKKYKIVDLIEYLDISTLSYALSSFNQNYTLVNAQNLRTKNFKSLFETLSRFSESILANSLKSIFENSLIDDILGNIENIEKENNFLKDANLLEDVKIHLKKIKNLKSEDDYKKYFNIGKILLERGYILNSITILNEALPLYLHYNFDRLSILKPKDKSYATLSSISNFLKTEDIDNKLLESVNSYFYCANYEIFNSLYYLSDSLKTTRNDLAHANGEKNYEDIKKNIKDIFDDFEKLIIKDNIAKNLTTKIEKNSKYARYNKIKFEELIEKKYQEIFPQHQDNPNSTKKILKDKRTEELYNNINSAYSEIQKEFAKFVHKYNQIKTLKNKRKDEIDNFYENKILN